MPAKMTAARRRAIRTRGAVAKLKLKKAKRTKKIKTAKKVQSISDRLFKKRGVTRKKTDKTKRAGSYGSKKLAEQRAHEAAYGHLKKKKKK